MCVNSLLFSIVNANPIYFPYISHIFSIYFYLFLIYFPSMIIQRDGKIFILHFNE